MQELRQSSEIKVRIGCAMDATDGVVPETSLALGTADQAEVLKHNGAGTVDIAANTFAAITNCGGWYDLTLTAGNTDTLGQLTIVIQDSSLMTPIFRDFMVVTANYFDSKYSTDKLQVDVMQIGGVAQSLTDLKDLVDTGYDPATHKIQGVVLADTTTTNTDMVGTAGANTVVPDAAGIAATPANVATALTDINLDHLVKSAVDTNFATTVHLDSVVGQLADVGTSATFDRTTDSQEAIRNVEPHGTSMRGTNNAATETKQDIIDTNVDQIETAVITNAAGVDIAADIIAVKAETVSILTDTGTTLDTLIKDIPTTAEFEARSDLAGTAATPAEVATALTNIHLDHLLAADYDPASKPGVATALLNELVENDGGVSRYTANALENAPSAGTNPNVLIDTTIAAVTDQTHFTLTAGSNDDNAYKDQAIAIYDANDSDYPSIRVCSAYTGATKTVTLDSAPDFTVVNGDGCKAFVTAPGTTAPTVGQIRTEMEGAGTKLLTIEGYTDKIDDATNGLAAIKAEVEGLAGAAMRGTDSANTTTPPTVMEIRTEMDTNGTKMAPSQTLADYKATGFNTTVPDIAGTAATLHGTTDGKIDVIDGIVDRILTAGEIRQSSVNDAGATTTKFISSLTETTDDFWNRMAILFTSGQNSGQMRRVKDYVGTTKEITIQTPLSFAPANADTFIICAVRAFITPDIEDIADAVLDELIAGHTIAGSLSKKISDQVNPPSQTLNDYKATGFSTHDAAAVKAAIEAAGSSIALVKAVTDALTSAAATKLAASAGTIVTGTAATGTLSTTEMTTDLTISVDDQTNGRILIFLPDTATAALRNQATDILDSAITNGKLTFTALTTAPSNGDTFCIV